MNTIEISINIVISLVTGASSGYFMFKYLGRKWIENWFAKDLKRYEHKLDVLKIKDEIRFNFLHKERIDIIKELYKSVFELNELNLYLIMPTEMQEQFQFKEEDLIKKNYQKSHNLSMYLLSNEIYIPKILVDRIAGMCYTYQSITKSIMNDNSEKNKKQLDTFYIEKVRPLLNDLRDEFRKLLGVEFYDNELMKIDE